MGNPDQSRSERDRDIEALRARVAFLEEERDKWRKAEADHALSEERYRILVETMNEGVGVTTEQGLIAYVNDRLAQMLECERHELVGRLVADVARELQPVARLAEAGGRPTGHATAYELSLTTKSGNRLVVRMSPASIASAEGRHRGAFAVFTDVTELTRAQNALLEEGNLLRTLMDSIPDFAYVKDRESRFISTNSAHLRTLGAQTLADVVGKTDFDFFPQELAQHYYEAEQEVMASGVPLEDDVEKTLDPAGGELWVMTYKAPLYDSDGTVAGIVGVSRDITELRLTERALRESQERLRLILEGSGDMAYRLDLDTESYEYISPSALKVLGFSRAELIEMALPGFLNRIHPDDREALSAHRRDCQESRDQSGPPAVVEYRFKHKSGSYRWMAESANLVREDGRTVGVVGAIRDITASKESERAVRAASRMEATATLAGGIAHDFNNLMVGVLGNAELLRMRLADDDKAGRMIDTITQSAQQVAELARQMLAFARGGKYEPSGLDLNDVVAEALRLQQRAAPAGVRVEFKPEPDLWHILADPTQMAQVVTNLVLNAVEAIEDKGEVVVTSSNVEADEEVARTHAGLSPGRYVRLSIEDTGHGMSADVVGRVFEPFFTTHFQGRGLGLAAAYGIVKNHDGHIAVRSEEGVGSSFAVYLPALEKRVGTPAAEAPAMVSTGGETVLVVEDEEMVRDVIASLLERLGYRVLCAANGREAVDLAQAHEGDIHLVLLDMAMPVMDGIEAFPLLKEARPGLKVVICSGYGLDPATRRLLDDGAAAFIQKPFPVRRLAAKVRQVLDN